MTERRYLIMKKITAIVLLMAMVFSLAGCGNSVSIGAFSSKYFNYDDYDAAVRCMVKWGNLYSLPSEPSDNTEKASDGRKG